MSTRPFNPFTDPRPSGYRITRVAADKRRGGLPARFALRGDFRLAVIGPDGKEKEVREVRNLVVNAGLDYLKEFILDAVTPTAIARMGWIAGGSDATPVTAADTALGAELARLAFATYTAGGTGVASVDATFGAGVGTGSWAEAGIFNANAAGTMLNRVTFAAVNKAAGDSLKVTFTLTIANAP